MKHTLNHSVSEWQEIVVSREMWERGYPTNSNQWDYAETFLKLSPRSISRFVPIVPASERVAA